ncbi:MAG: CpaF family protein, partial [Oscillospiraceae bacterium]|nr:CpaF family protein [Oscillospiraceae bacterium]
MMKVSRAETVKKFGTEIDRIVGTARKWITENDTPPSDEEILTKCEDEYFGSDISLKASSHETVMIIDSLQKRLTGKYGILTGLLEDPLINEIMVNGPERIYVEREKILIRVDDAFTSRDEREEMIRMFASDVHREINEAN